MSEKEESSANIEVSEDEIESDDDHEQTVDEDYSYSQDSVSSHDSDGESQVTSVTRRSSMSEHSSIFSSKESARSASKISDNQERTYTSFNSSRTPLKRVNPTPRRNMSFSNMEMMKIERENQYLLRKIMAHQRPKKSIPCSVMQVRPASSAINRKKMQSRIDQDNMTILRKIQTVKSSSLSGKIISGQRFTSI